jgi:hypothetical protein
LRLRETARLQPLPVSRAALRLRGRVTKGGDVYFYSRDIGRTGALSRGSNTPTPPSPARGGGLGRGHQRGHHLAKSRWGDRPVWWHEGKRHRPNLASHWGSKYGIEELIEVKYLRLGGIDR